MEAGFGSLFSRVLPIGAIAAIAACSGNSQTLPSSGPSSTALDAVMKKTGIVRFAIDIPDAKKTLNRAPQYVSPSTQSVSVHAAGAVKSFDLTASSPGCSANKKTASLDCTVTLVLPVGSQTIAAALFAGLKGEGDALASGTAKATVIAGGAKLIVIPFDGIVSTATVLLNSKPEATLPAGTPATLKVTVDAYDAKGNLITAPGHYASPVGLKSSDALPKLSASSVSTPDAKVTLEYSGGAVASKVTSTIAPSVDGKPDVKGAAVLSISPGGPAVKPGSLTFTTAASQTFTVEEIGYDGSLTAASSAASTATVSPGSADGPKATFTVTPVNGGAATITVRDGLKQTAKVSISVSSGTIIIDGSQTKQSHGGTR